MCKLCRGIVTGWQRRLHLSFPFNFSFLKFLFIYILAVLGLCCCTGFSLDAASGGYSLVVVCKLLIVMASLVAEHGF